MTGLGNYFCDITLKAFYVRMGNFLRLLILLLVLNACSGLKYVPENKYLYTGKKLIFDSLYRKEKAYLVNKLESSFSPNPNNKLIVSRPRLWIYYAVGEPKKEKGLRQWIRKNLGKSPVYLDLQKIDRTATIIKKKLVNLGYFNGSVDYQINRSKKTATVDYFIKVGRRYHVKDIKYPEGKDPLTKNIKKLINESELRSGNPFELETLYDERKRITNELRNLGYFYFDERYLIFLADSLSDPYKVSLEMKIKDNAPQKALKAYTLNNILVWVKNRQEEFADEDSINISRGLNFLIHTDYLNPEYLQEQIVMGPGTLYSKRNHDRTLDNLSSMNLFRYINTDFKSKSLSDSMDLTITALTARKKSLRLETFMVSKSGNFIGPNINFSITNRNALRRAELLQVNASLGFQTQIQGNQEGFLNAFEASIEPSLTFPRFLMPFGIRVSNRIFNTKTIINLGVAYESRIDLFTFNSISSGITYQWNITGSLRHELKPLSVDFVRVPNISSAFNDLLEESPLLKQSFNEQFITGLQYSLFYHSKLKDEFDPIDIYFNANMETSGNLLSGINQVVGGNNTNQDGRKEVFNLAYSQFIKGDVELRWLRRLNKKRSIAARLIAGAGLAYGNSNTLPYIKQFAIGGSSSIRAFQARSIGPGSYTIPDSVRENSQFIDQAGDLKFEANAEYRFNLFDPFEGALYVDAGNIWTLKQDESRPGSKFEFGDMFRELAVGTGIGLRLNAQIFIFRLDVAFPLRSPAAPPGNRWVIDDLRTDDLIYNLAIGYPF